jgi:hypothetical protein
LFHDGGFFQDGVKNISVSVYIEPNDLFCAFILDGMETLLIHYCTVSMSKRYSFKALW